MRNAVNTAFDAQLILKDAGLVAASAAATVASVAKVLDMGAARFEGRVIIDATAIEVDTGNELYTILAQVSNTADMSTGVFNAGSIRLGHSSTTLETASTAVGRRELAFTNQINGVTYRYMRLYTVVAGTIATGINFTAVLGTKA